MAFQQPLWQDDPYALLLKEDASNLGKFRLRRYLNWLDTTGADWKSPDLAAYARFLKRRHNLSEPTITTEISRIRNHYRVVLTTPVDNGDVPDATRRKLATAILGNLGFKDPQTVIYGAETKSENMRVIMPDGSGSYVLARFARWLDQSNRHWTQPDIPHYRSALAHEGFKPGDVKNHVKTVRNRYAQLRSDDAVLDTLEPHTRVKFLEQLDNRLGLSRVYDEKFRVEDDPSSWVFWLSKPQEDELVSSPDTSTLIGLRDRAIIGLALHTGAKPIEMHHLQVEDLSSNNTITYSGRTVALQSVMPGLGWVNQWLEAAHISDGPVFRSVYTNSTRLRDGKLNTSAMTKMLRKYPILHEDRQRELVFPDLRCTYARRLYEHGIAIDDIQQLVGYASVSSLLTFMGLQRV